MFLYSEFMLIYVWVYISNVSIKNILHAKK